MRKTTYLFILVSFFLLGFSFSSMVFSEEEVEMKIIVSSNGNTMMKIFTPVSLQAIYLEVYHGEDQLLAGIHAGAYSVEKIKGGERNVFLIHTEYFEGKEDILFKLFPDTSREDVFWLKDIEKVYDGNGQVNKMENNLNRLKVMTFNIHHGKDKFGFYTLDQIGKLIIENEIDIIGLQEVDKYVVRSKFENQVKKIAKDTSMYYAFVPNMKWMGAEYGNAILSKYPIESFENIQLPGFRERRGLLISKIKVGDQPVNFLVTHLGLTKEEKKNQFAVVNKYIEYLGEKTILVGDFNSREEHEGIQNLKYHLTDAAAESENCYAHTYSGIVIKTRIDYIFVSPDMKSVDYQVIDSNISDHLPVVATLEF